MTIQLKHRLPATLRLRSGQASNQRPATGKIFGSIAGWLISFFGKSPAKPTAADLKRIDFGTSTQHLGIRFTEKIRSIFRFKWLKKS
ncbi:MAG: hypothetical protein KAQ89_04065 [Planctomycetes bacterium]|nr:hypothetical protein [Planctomycetota bacterium]